jgi:prepilin-type N-terminal cleavage/methylation domain-containing protein
MSPRPPERARAPYRLSAEQERGFTLVELLVGLVVTGLIFVSIHLVIGNAVSAKLIASNRIAGQNQGRLVVGWIADRVRQAGFRANPTSAITRCRNGIVSQDASYYPTATTLSVTGDVDNTGTPQTRTFKIETVGGVQSATETVIPCAAGATASDQPLTDRTSVSAQSLTFVYFDSAGSPVTNLTSPTAIQSIRTVEITFQVRARLGRNGPTDQTWTTRVALRNP